MNQTAKFPLLGVVLILFGGLLLLNNLGVLYLERGKILWLGGAIVGGIIVIDSFIHKHRDRVFWGSVLFFASVMFSIEKWRVIEPYGSYWIPAMSTAVGLAFLMLFFYEPRDVAILIPAFLFTGFGVVWMLVDLEILDWFDVRHYIRNYWPVALILWGVAILLRRRPRASSN